MISSRIILATPLYPPEIGGPATDAFALREKLEQSGYIPVVVPFSRVRGFPPGIRHLRYAYELGKVARDAACIVSFDTVSVGLPALLIAQLFRIPLVVRVPGDYAWEQGVQRFGVTDSIESFQTKRYGFRVECLRTLQYAVVRHADLVIVPSNFFKRIISRWGVAHERVRRIYLGMDMKDAYVLPEHIPSGKILCSIGRFVPWKGFQFLIELLPKLPGWSLVLVGDGPLRTELEQRAKELGVSDCVVFTGVLPHAEVLGWLHQASAFALNTSFESFSFQILEAMGSGVPVITTPIGSIPELIENGREGVLCKPNDADAFVQAIQSVESERELWQGRTEAAKQKTERFSIEASTSAFVDALKEICA